VSAAKRKTRTDLFVRRTRLAAPADAVFAWHAEPGALQRLVPPWEPVDVVSERGGIADGAEVVLRVRAGPLPVLWVAWISDCIPGRQFRDTQVRGPFAFWEHTHRMVPDGPAASYLEDRVVYALPLGRWPGGRFARRKIERMFEYRHRVTREAVEGAGWTKTPAAAY
jgi:ligand-binding SRPBCC domain-containing protein